MDLLLLLPFPVIGFVDSGATSHICQVISFFSYLFLLYLSKILLTLQMALSYLFHTVGLCLHPGFFMINSIFLRWGQTCFLSVTLQLTIFVRFLLLSVLSRISAREGSLAGWESYIIWIFFSTFLFFFSCFSRIRNGTRRRLGHTQHTVQDFFHCLEYIPAFHSDGLNNSCDCLQLAIVCSRIKHKNPNSSVPFFGLIHSLVSTCDLTLFDLRLI